ncbi:MAG: SpoIIE family protein phosphatase [Candidatus Riflebacteria bacterium]|nr:SpoIIE family protein phosphatase [Candidatus Riflebacteria bacterium]
MKERLAALARRLQPWLAAAVLAALPLVFLRLGWERDLDHALALARREAQLPFEQFRHNLQQNGRLEMAISGYGEAVVANLGKGPDAEERLRGELATLKGRFPGTFEIACFRPDGSLIASLSDLHHWHEALDGFGRDRIALVNGDPTPMWRHLPAYRPFLGCFRARKIRDFVSWRGALSSFHRRRGYSFLTTAHPGRPWFLLWVNLPEDIREFGYRFWMTWQPPLTPDTQIAIVDLRQPLENLSARLASSPAVLHHALLRLGQEEDGCLFDGGWIWSQAVISPAKRVVMARPDAPLAAWQEAWRRLDRGLALLFLAGTAAGAFCLGRADRWSLRVKILVLFLYTSGVPLGLLALAARGLLADREVLLQNRRFQVQEDILGEAARLPLERLSLFEAVLRHHLGPPLPRGARAVPEAIARVQRFLKVLHPELCQLFDAQGRNLVNQVAGFRRELAPVTQIMGMLARQRAAEINGTDPGLQDATKEQALRATLESMGIDLEPFTAMLEENVNHFTFSTLANSAAHYLVFRLLDLAGRNPASLVILWGRDELFEDLPRHLLRFASHCGEIKVGAALEWFVRTPDFPAGKEIQPLNLAARRQAAAVHRTLPWASGSLLMSGIFAPENDEHVYFAASTDQAIQADLRFLAWRLGATGIGLVAFGLALGLLLSRQFLRPLGRFGEGLTAIRARDFRKRLPVEGGDEFARLAETYNTVLEGMADLEVARIVQETFFPREPLRAAGWEVFGSTLSASRVGGDYFDYFPLPDGRWLLVIGDITGHGVAASLGVAMAKAVVCHPGNPDHPSGIMTLMNGMVMGGLEQSRMMTCFLAIFDPRDGRFVATNAGHNFPYLVGPGAAGEMAIRHPMLGFKTRKPFEEVAWTLGPDDWICLYTDGLIEALGLDGASIGYEEFRAGLPGWRRPDATATHDAIRSWHAARRAVPALDDDATLVILQRSHPPDR